MFMLLTKVYALFAWMFITQLGCCFSFTKNIKDDIYSELQPILFNQCSYCLGLLCYMNLCTSLLHCYAPFHDIFGGTSCYVDFEEFLVSKD